VLSKSKTSPTGGLLRFTDILELKQHADLVVLSACDTGLGQLREAEGIIGLTRAFLYGGASSAVVSLWKVEDQSTGLLMQEFHRRLKAGQSKEEALREAKLKIMNTQILLKATGIRSFWLIHFSGHRLFSLATGDPLI
jgi:CHAT domain-containing protein